MMMWCTPRPRAEPRPDARYVKCDGRELDIKIIWIYVRIKQFNNLVRKYSSQVEACKCRFESESSRWSHDLRNTIHELHEWVITNHSDPSEALNPSVKWEFMLDSVLGQVTINYDWWYHLHSTSTYSWLMAQWLRDHQWVWIIADKSGHN